MNDGAFAVGVGPLEWPLAVKKKALARERIREALFAEIKAILVGGNVGKKMSHGQQGLFEIGPNFVGKRRWNIWSYLGLAEHVDDLLLGGVVDLRHSCTSWPNLRSGVGHRELIGCFGAV